MSPQNWRRKRSMSPKKNWRRERSKSPKFKRHRSKSPGNWRRDKDLKTIHTRRYPCLTYIDNYEGKSYCSPCKSTRQDNKCKNLRQDLDDYRREYGYTQDINVLKT
jgi:hypothetical protein